MTTHSVATVHSVLFGGSTGNYFNDLQSVIGPHNVTINSIMPIKSITVVHAGVIDGIKVTYYRGSKKSTTSVNHGLSAESDGEGGLNKKVIPLGDKESIVAISGKAGDSEFWGMRVVGLCFTIYDSGTGKMRTTGWIGGQGGTHIKTPTFRVTANGSFLALGGYAIDANSSIGTMQDKQEDGGLYGLTFIDIAYRNV
ncbi:hypothetical protein B0H16DRAFT_455092 [Mycena metata]|uniref:Jacalin-type lectin domain-containing protein n=1 Tax=Mycena metata TaxID=1033252 RepID=A0AAD7NJH9_9AGAR|nr:hypothetical protein B0H16DRAFT_455092 [Mycena metata]